MFESLLELGMFALYIAGSGLLTVLGAVTEYQGIQNALSGDNTMALWFVWMGTVALIAGLMLARDKVLHRVTA
ncbi:hypothetical protein ZOD2009_11220 [Haladaptatus paucihalophilus DX253]|uniref:DUF8151 domain-containing protein n=1 Tax=Haladaptatus paucihalophilus DX253 TaxID=797209 RepID=E7QTW4_HALPU|nr:MULTISPECIES: hypothetical protein [Haladaptatus]EFW92043.1 hypothetical protein ZOD2009_11220 [Haladaptatus paucihalophilus DX253]ODR82450.1 hypothetical protein BG842_20530 [Haladaptatus sp. W1]GKZ14198.1 hypothetical protein HAL_20790 [Haladaptatus sp. T7]SHK86659.1 hypothetical protein SAMN05444342_2447 [Haladaptatus paucihalophilus DX253]